MSGAEEHIDCAEHGNREATFVCQHLSKGQGRGFHQSRDEEDPGAPFPDAWCDECETYRQQEGGWTPRSEAKARVQLLCSACYLVRRELNWPSAKRVEEAELIHRSVHYLQDRQDSAVAEFRLNDHERYDWNQESAQLVFSSQGKPVVIADFQFVGSFSARTNTWLWSWANESDSEQTRRRLEEVRAYGEEHRLMKLACAYWGAAEEDGWEMTAVAAHLLNAKGAYRSPDEHKFVFMILTDIRWAQ